MRNDRGIIENILLAYVKDREYVDERKLLLHTARAFEDVFQVSSYVEVGEVLDELVAAGKLCYVEYCESIVSQSYRKLYFIGATEFRISKS